MDENFDFKIEQLLTPVIKALQILDGSGTIEEIEENVITLLNLSEEKVNEIYKANITKLNYQLAIVCLYLKELNFLKKSEQGIWVLTIEGLNAKEINPENLKFKLDNYNLQNLIEPELQSIYNPVNELLDLDWQSKLLNILKQLPPNRFERLCQRLLRELGFHNVLVTGKSGDGGIDGKGVIRVNGIVSFNIAFQCKRYQGTVSASEVRDFKGALMGRADKGLFLTTGKFSRDARKEAQRDGAVQIDLVDGLEFTNKLKEVGLGIHKEVVEKISIDKEFFNSL